jgi:hypothetical protein
MLLLSGTHIAQTKAFTGTESTKSLRTHSCPLLIFPCTLLGDDDRTDPQCRDFVALNMGAYMTTLALTSLFIDTQACTP